MAVFVYTGRTRGGQTITGEMEAANREAVVARLRSQQVIATAVRTKPRDITIPGFGGKVTDKDIVVFTRQFATMIDAGLPLVQCLEILASQQDNKTLQEDADGDSSIRGGRLDLRRRPEAAPQGLHARSTPTWWRRARRAASWTRS